MKVAIFSDVHGNLPALETFVAATRKAADAYICLGDVVNYGPWNDECIAIVEALPGVSLLQGNHERIFLGVEDMKHELPLVKDFTSQSMKYFSRPDYLAKTTLSVGLRQYTCIHTIDNKSIYSDTNVTIDRDYIIGHSHHQYKIKRNGYDIINPGSLGQNRAFIDSIEYLMLDTESGVIQLFSLPYDVTRILNEMHYRKYPQHCIDYYANKPRKYG